MMKKTATKPFAKLSATDLRIVKGAATLSSPPPPSIDWTRTNYGFTGPLGVDTRDCD